jgi:uncharacterized repeat protein (TIGR03837 family)
MLEDSMSVMHDPLHCAIYCRVIDNFGDIGVCWRLARELAKRYGWSVRLVVDDISSWERLAGEAGAIVAHQDALGIKIECWPGMGHSVAMDIVIEAFACELPIDVHKAMIQQAEAPVWINLEYFATEEWAQSCHGLSSPHPPLTKHFFFPGLVPGTGGVIQELDYDSSRDMTVSNSAQDQLEMLKVFVFCYPTLALEMLVLAIENSRCKTRLTLAPGIARDDLLARIRPERLEFVQITLAPFVPQTMFDDFLWKSDLNFVRGEDSCVRAQLAGNPWVWQPYRQDEDAHHAKRAALEERLCAGAPSGAALAWRALQDAWNADEPSKIDIDHAWSGWLNHREALALVAAQWSSKMRAQPDLCHNLFEFVHARRSTAKARRVQDTLTPR